MAYLVPSDVPHSVLQEAHAPKLETLAVFRSKLSPELTVYHGVHWKNEHRKFVVFGELDFVVVSPSGQLLVIEQKNGQLEETAGGLVTDLQCGRYASFRFLVRKYVVISFLPLTFIVPRFSQT
jgi:hypothetical protein